MVGCFGVGFFVVVVVVVVVVVFVCVCVLFFGGRLFCVLW